MIGIHSFVNVDLIHWALNIIRNKRVFTSFRSVFMEICAQVYSQVRTGRGPSPNCSHKAWNCPNCPGMLKHYQVLSLVVKQSIKTWMSTESWPQPDRAPLGWIRTQTARQAFSSNISYKCASVVVSVLTYLNWQRVIGFYCSKSHLEKQVFCNLFVAHVIYYTLISHNINTTGR